MTDDLSVAPVTSPCSEPGTHAGLAAFPPRFPTETKHHIIIMNHPYLPALRRQPRRRETRSFKPLLLLPAAGLVFACASCAQSSPKPPPPPVTDTAPVGDGLKVIGFAVLGAAVVGVLGRMLK
jgi:hypothetical protein